MKRTIARILDERVINRSMFVEGGDTSSLDAALEAICMVVLDVIRIIRR